MVILTPEQPDVATDDIIERVAIAIERTMFAPHEFPLPAELHAKYRATAQAAIKAMWKPSKSMVDKAWEMIGSNLRYEEVYGHMIDAALEAACP